jgi:hypothetical protein
MRRKENPKAKFYKELVISKTEDYDKIVKALRIAENFIRNRKKTLVGGIAINYALKIKEHRGLYSDLNLPDLDIISDTHFKDAYDLAAILHKSGINGISVINALHPSTMKVRVDFKEVADITYVPTKVLDKVPVLHYKGYQFIHPHFQYIDQHRSMVYPYENMPYATILKRPIKDMTRYTMLYKFYPMRVLFTNGTKIFLKKYTIPKELTYNSCISGFVALNYWIGEAKKLGYNGIGISGNLGFTNIGDSKNSNLEFEIPDDINGITIYTDNFKSLYDKILANNSNSTKTFYSRFLDKLPRKIIIDNLYEILDNNQMIAANLIDKENNIYMANMQSVMMYILINYIILMRIVDKKKSYAYFEGYNVCRNLIQWASNEYALAVKEKDDKRREKIKRFLPTDETYGIRNYNDSYIVTHYKFDQKNVADSELEDIYKQPKNMYDHNIYAIKKNDSMRAKFYDFDYKSSQVYDLTGDICSKFW